MLGLASGKDNVQENTLKINRNDAWYGCDKKKTTRRINGVSLGLAIASTYPKKLFDNENDDDKSLQTERRRRLQQCR